MMLDLSSQYVRLRKEIDEAIQDVLKRADFINGAAVKTFCDRLSAYMDIPHVVPCGNGTDALRFALQALEVGADNDVLVPDFTYIAPIEAIASVGASPIMVDVDPHTYNIDPELIEKAITARTKAIIVVHLFGQSCDMEPILKIANKYRLSIIEDNAQSLGSSYMFSDGSSQKTGTVGRIGITSFFPTKPLGCYGDGGAIFTSDGELAEQVRLFANHGQSEKYHHKIIGSNSRLDTLQAAILNVKLNHMDEFTARRREIAKRYDQTLTNCTGIFLPKKSPFSDHVYHQYTIRVLNDKRDVLKTYLAEKKIPSMIYYPLPVHEQEAYKWVARLSGNLTEARSICKEALSLPIDPEMTDERQSAIIEAILQFFSEQRPIDA